MAFMHSYLKTNPYKQAKIKRAEYPPTIIPIKKRAVYSAAPNAQLKIKMAKRIEKKLVKGATSLLISLL